MAVFRVERTSDYTVMSNHHLKNRCLSLKAKGLLSQMLSLPEEWDYTLAGLASINKESVDAIRTAVQELERAGYITRRQCRDDQGKLTGNAYTIYEQPRFEFDRPSDTDTPEVIQETSAQPLLDFPITDNPVTENPSSKKPVPENPTQLNTKELNTKDIEKKTTKRKGGRQRVNLTDQELSDRAIAWIAKVGGGWHADGKNALYTALLRFYAPRATKKETPAHTVAGFDSLVDDLLKGSQGDPGVMVAMLNKATQSRWKSVYPPHGAVPAASSQPDEGVIHL